MAVDTDLLSFPPRQLWFHRVRSSWRIRLLPLFLSSKCFLPQGYPLIYYPSAYCAIGNCQEGNCPGLGYTTDGFCGKDHAFLECGGTWGKCCSSAGRFVTPGFPQARILLPTSLQAVWAWKRPGRVDRADRGLATLDAAALLQSAASATASQAHVRGRHQHRLRLSAPAPKRKLC